MANFSSDILSNHENIACVYTKVSAFIASRIVYILLTFLNLFCHRRYTMRIRERCPGRRLYQSLSSFMKCSDIFVLLTMIDRRKGYGARGQERYRRLLSSENDPLMRRIWREGPTQYPFGSLALNPSMYDFIVAALGGASVVVCASRPLP